MSTWSPRETIEGGPGFRSGIRDIIKYSDLNKFGAGLTAAVFGCTGPALIILQAAEDGGLTDAQAVSWLFGIYVLGGIITLLMALYYKQPIMGAWAIPGAVLIGIVLSDFNLQQAAGAYLISGVAVFLIGISGTFRDVVDRLPQPIIMGMIAGVLISFTVDIVNSVSNAPYIAGIGFIGYLVFYRYFENFPGIVGAIILGTAAAFWQGATAFSNVDLQIAQPELIVPTFSLESMISIALPLTILVIGAENMQAIGVLQAEE